MPAPRPPAAGFRAAGRHRRAQGERHARPRPRRQRRARPPRRRGLHHQPGRGRARRRGRGRSSPTGGSTPSSSTPAAPTPAPAPRASTTPTAPPSTSPTSSASRPATSSSARPASSASCCRWTRSLAGRRRRRRGARDGRARGRRRRDQDHRHRAQGGRRAPGDGWSVGGMAKGAGMLAPALATMLVVVTTDAVVDPGDLDAALRAATARRSTASTPTAACRPTTPSSLLASGASGVAVDRRRAHRAR